MVGYTREQVAGAIDHTLLKTTATLQDIIALCKEAVALGVVAVCVPPCYVAASRQALQGTPVRIATVIGFPNGYSSTEAKAHEAAVAVHEGAHEVDMVINIGRAKSADWAYVQNDILQVVSASRSAVRGSEARPVLVKVIIETAALTDDEKRKACEAAKAAGADYVKTSTGFGGGGATVEDVRLMRSVVGQAMGVKASGGVRTLQQAEAMLDAGATRLGTSSGAAIMREIDERGR